MISGAELAQRFVLCLDVLSSAAWQDAVACWEAFDEAARDTATRALVGALTSEQLHGSAMFLAHNVEEHVFEHWSLAGYQGLELIQMGDRTVTVASQAAFAILVREALDPTHFQVLYAPFAAVMPIDELERASA